MINNKKNQKYSEACANIGASFLPLDFEVFGRTSDEVLKLVHDLVEKAAEIKQLSFSQHYRENALFILNSSAHALSATNRFDPECEHHLDEVLNKESFHCS